ncbi:MAG TPA: lipopolysaccharide assembly protein LapA domain-containing protein [Pseudonocardia sp.]|jgi:uncharacterized integral membrane protein
MVEDQRPGEWGPEDGNGGPVKPGSEPHHPDGAGNGSPGANGGGGGNGANGGGGSNGGTVIAPETRRKTEHLKRTRVSGLWAGLILSAIVLIFLLIFIVQNGDSAQIKFLGAQASLPLGVALLFAAALGVLLVAIPGGLRIMQLRREARRRGLR